MEDSEIALRKIAKGAGIFSIGLLVAKILGYAYRLIIARLGAEQYGLLSITMAVFGILTMFALLGIGEGVIRFVSFYKGRSDEGRIKGVITSALKITLPVSLAFGFLLFILSDWTATIFFHNAELSLLFKVFAFAIPLDVLRSIFVNALQSFQRIEYNVYAKSIVENVAKVVLTFITIYLGLGVVGAAIAYVFAIFVSFVASFYFLEKKVFPIIKTKTVSTKINKELLFYSFPLLFTSFVYLIIQWTDTLMLGYFRTPIEVGVYNVALPTAFLLFLVPSSIRTLFFPVLNEFYAQNKQKLFKSIYRTVVKWIVLVDAILFVFLVIFSKAIIKFLFGEVYIADKIMFLGQEFSVSVLALIILATGMILPEFLVPSKDVLLTLKKTKLVFFNTLVGALANIVLNYSLIPVYGAVGAAIATAIAYFLINILLLVESYIITRINPFNLNSLKAMAISLFLLILLYSLKLYRLDNIFYVVSVSFFCLILYLTLLVITKSFEKEDVMILNAIEQKTGIKLGIEKLLKRFI